MQKSTSVGSYLFRRLRQVGVHHVFGVPGDFTLKALDHVKTAGSSFVVNCNELNAGYAADGYARVQGLGAVFTTYGVGELSAINAIAGSYAEHVPVIKVVGLPQRSLINSKAIVHHTMGDGRMGVFEEMYSKVTSYTALLEKPNTAGETIDTAISVAMRSSRPTYLALPCDMVNEPITADALDRPIVSQFITRRKLSEKLATDIRALLRGAKRPILLVDRGMGMDSLRNEINQFACDSGIPTLTMPSGASMIDHDLPNYLGVHAGPVGQFDTMPLINSADVLLEFGPMYSDTQTLGFSVVPKVPNTVRFAKNSIDLQGSTHEGLDVGLILKDLMKNAKEFKVKTLYDEAKNLPNFRSFPIPTPLTGKTQKENITQNKLYLRLNSYLRPNDTILLANATPILGGRDFVLPDRSCRVIVSGLWFSIGHMLPAALGAGLAQQRLGKGRVVLFDGDGSFQVTAQELSTIIRHRLNMTIFIINNRGYAYERLIHNARADYHDIALWKYIDLPRVMGASEAIRAAKAAGEEYSIKTMVLWSWEDLENFLADERFDNGFGGKGTPGLRLVDIRVGKTDVPDKFKKVFESAGQKLG